MLIQLEKVQKKWGGSQRIIDAWLNERQAVLVEYCELAGLPPFNTAKSAQPSFSDVEHFCQRLIDYISVGHFEVFNAIENSDEKIKKKAQGVIKLINKSTDFALKFNDSYVKLDQATALNNLDHDLAKLGPFLEERFQLEDKLIALLCEPAS